MDSQPTAKALQTRISNDIRQLLTRFENILAIAPNQPPNHTSTAVESYQLDVESAALVRAAEDILSLTRLMKETWLFGQLGSFEASDEKGREGAQKLEGDVRAVREGLGRLKERI